MALATYVSLHPREWTADETPADGLEATHAVVITTIANQTFHEA